MTDLSTMFMDPQPWKLAAACRGIDTAIFFPEKHDGQVEAQIRRAKMVCSACPADTVDACLRYAVLNNITTGVWAGKTPEERRPFRRLLFPYAAFAPGGDRRGRPRKVD